MTKYCKIVRLHTVIAFCRVKEANRTFSVGIIINAGCIDFQNRLLDIN